MIVIPFYNLYRSNNRRRCLSMSKLAERISHLSEKECFEQKEELLKEITEGKGKTFTEMANHFFEARAQEPGFLKSGTYKKTLLELENKSFFDLISDKSIRSTPEAVFRTLENYFNENSSIGLNELFSDYARNERENFTVKTGEAWGPRGYDTLNMPDASAFENKKAIPALKEFMDFLKKPHTLEEEVAFLNPSHWDLISVVAKDIYEKDGKEKISFREKIDAFANHQLRDDKSDHAASKLLANALVEYAKILKEDYKDSTDRRINALASRFAEKFDEINARFKNSENEGYYSAEGVWSHYWNDAERVAFEKAFDSLLTDFLEIKKGTIEQKIEFTKTIAEIANPALERFYYAKELFEKIKDKPEIVEIALENPTLKDKLHRYVISEAVEGGYPIEGNAKIGYKILGQKYSFEEVMDEVLSYEHRPIGTKAVEEIKNGKLDGLHLLALETFAEKRTHENVDGFTKRTYLFNEMFSDNSEAILTSVALGILPSETSREQIYEKLNASSEIKNIIISLDRLEKQEGKEFKTMFKLTEIGENRNSYADLTFEGQYETFKKDCKAIAAEFEKIGNKNLVDFVKERTPFSELKEELTKISFEKKIEQDSESEKTSNDTEKTSKKVEDDSPYDSDNEY